MNLVLGETNKQYPVLCSVGMVRKRAQKILSQQKEDQRPKPTETNWRKYVAASLSVVQSSPDKVSGKYLHC